jgi:hypothetical protein
MVKVGNMFELAEKELINEGKDYTLLDIIDYAIKIRKWVSRNGKKLKKEEKRIKHNEANKRYKLKTKRIK